MAHPFALRVRILNYAGLALAAFIASLVASFDTSAQPATAPPKPCLGPADANRTAGILTNTARALRERKRIRILAVGTSPIAQFGEEGGAYKLVESLLESNYPGLDVEIIDRSISGELAKDARNRIANEVALLQPDVVFWQVGVADGIARTPPEDLKRTLIATAAWLKAHDVDVVLIGMRYVRSLARNSHYGAIRKAIREAQKQAGVMRIGHYEAIETLDRIRHKTGEPASELDLTDAGSTCVAEFLSRALAAQLFSKAKPGDKPGLQKRPGPQN